MTERESLCDARFLCGGCNVREPWEHRCHKAGCHCEDCNGRSCWCAECLDEGTSITPLTPEQETVIPLPSRPSDVALPPYARRLDVRATRAAFAAGTLGTVGDNPPGEDGERHVVPCDLDRDDTHVMLTDHEPREWYGEAERLRQSRLRIWQTIR